MALLTGHSDTNKVRKQLPSTVTIRTPVAIGLSWYWVAEAITTESFSYVGMTQSAAEACAAAMVAAYTKNVTVYTVNDGTITSSLKNECVASVKAMPTGGRMWQVDVDVSDKVYSIEAFSS